MRTAEIRKTIPIGVKLEACLIALGFSLESIRAGLIRWDHTPPLGMRALNDDGTDFVPASNDPHYIQPLMQANHAIKTFGTPATTAGSDVHNIAKAKRLANEQAMFRVRLLARAAGGPKEQPIVSRWPRRKFRKPPVPDAS